MLDPAQNHTFRDHYLEVDLDLSEVVFIATANVLDTVPAPLLDRMDLVRLDGYTEDEKVFIAHRYLLPRQLERAGLRRRRARPSPTTRSSPSSAATPARPACARSSASSAGSPARRRPRSRPAQPLPVLDADHLVDWLGRAKVIDDVPERTQLPGVATGLAVTGHGGDVLFIETTAFPTPTAPSPGSRSPASSAT